MRKLMKNTSIIAIIALLVLTFSLPVCASEPATTANVNTTSGSVLLDDQAGLLSDSEAQDVLYELEQASSSASCNIAVITTNQGLGEDGINAYAKSYRENNLVDTTESNRTILLAIDISSRTTSIDTSDNINNNFVSDSDRESIKDYIHDDLTNNDFVNACKSFAQKSAEIANTYDNEGNKLKSAFPWGTRILISLVIAAIISVLVAFIIKNQLKSVAMKPDAADYIREGSLDITESRDYFLYSHVTKVAKPKHNSSSGNDSFTNDHF